MNVLGVAVFAIVAAILALTLKQYSPQIAVVVSVGAGVLLFGYIAASLLPVLQEVLSISLLSEGVAENIGTLFKCLGVCYVVQLAADSCRDAGQQAIASKVELAGKVTVLALALPMLKTVVSFLDDLIFL
ncbi:stage III sporulation AC/AD family protein [Acetanaerobacterium sp. MSJ-12]|uniref:Stage III sporulation AC/AD family protein n=1 Tax=Bittarella massiliensis (ex Durand et al. 2017) TaxID=1720313 RepID=A0AAP1LI48_9FIRM|nr:MULTISPECIES: stage III sporulation AC/AD family protein [Eubacteriales]MCB5940925.1 stage III sporulation AC/AD family protein [bacterium 210820-DFI.6.52]ERJ00534.1 putative stage III sporulation protein AD [Clostridium sp. ATCC 29733]MBC2870655.1 stage III sporulation AC/AD family protein [Bittarella massiliensis (ex Durand et al. 2017)]MBU5419395.1 stage III sporulation AC/AD family protein [Acetanaerobacterium sp. MSJ-12]MCQ4948918.1 stage III sporulation AC/AD family protein [Bittarell